MELDTRNPVTKTVVHYSCARPVEPPVGALYLDPVTGYREKWDGTDWVPLKKETKNGR